MTGSPRFHRTAVAVSSVMGLAFAAGNASAAGFALQNQNGSGTGLAFAGAAVIAEDAKSILTPQA